MTSSGNFPVLNHLKYKASSYTTSNIDAAGLQLGSTTGNAAQLNIGFKLGDGKFYWECYAASIPGSLHFGVCIDNADLNNVTSGKAIIGMRENGNKLVSTAPQTNSTSSSYGSSYASGGDILAVAMDFTNSTMEFFINNSSQGSFSWSSANDGSTYYPYLYMNTGVATMNTGQDSSFCSLKTAQGNTDENGFGDFYYAPPTGFLAMCSANLPTSDDIDAGGDNGADDNPSKQFGVLTWTGTGSSNALTGLGFAPDLCWIKKRNSSQAHVLMDTSRGTSEAVESNSSGVADTNFTQGVTAFGTDGFTVGTHTQVNNSSDTYVGWCWKANGATTASNSNGAISSVVQANTKSGFSIVTFTGLASSNFSSTVGHGLTKAPEFIVHKARDTGGSWGLQHVGLSAVTKVAALDGTGAENDLSSYGTLSAPTSSVFSVNGVEGIGGGGSARSYLTYCWHGVSGFSKFGRYIGNGNTDGPFISTGFRPRLLFLKRIDGSGSWLVSDSARRPNNDGTYRELYWNSDSAEATGADSHDGVEYFSNGFKLKGSNAGCNGNGNKYIYGAWGDLSAKYNNGF